MSTTVTATCAFNSITAPAFGAYANLNATDINANGTLAATCTNGLPYSVGIGAGSNYNAAGGMGGGYRNLKNGTSYLGYAVFQDAGYATPWGDGVNGSLGALKTALGSGGPDAYTFYAKIPAHQAAIAGAYSDSMVATVTY